MEFHTNTPVTKGLRELLQQLEIRLKLSQPLDMYLFGGMAVHLYTAHRASPDVNATFGGRLALPSDLAVEVTLEDGRPQLVYFDCMVSPQCYLRHPESLNQSLLVDFGLTYLRVKVLRPDDLAVTKILRLSKPDKSDLKALAKLGLITKDSLEKRALECWDYEEEPWWRAKLSEALEVVENNNSTLGELQ